MNEALNQQHCAFIALLGAPNAGKSTLLNQLVGSKVSIVSSKVQTTRTSITGIAQEGNAQLIFVDTPGIFNPNPKHKLERAMVQAAWDRVGETDMLAVLIDAKKGVCHDTEIIFKGLKDRNKKAVLILNKVDLIDREKLLGMADTLSKTGIFSDIFMVSALKGDGTADLKRYFAKHAPSGPWMYPEDQVSTAPMRFIASEITREKLFHRLHEELPYAISVETEQYQEAKDGSVKIHQAIYVQREGHKKIVIGKNGANIKNIGQLARKELESFLGCKVHLFLFVKVRENWIDNPETYQYMGLTTPK
jgi:GTP-binding protein Era